MSIPARRPAQHTSAKRKPQIPTLSTLDYEEEADVTILGNEIISKREFKKVMFSYVILIALFSTANNIIDILVDTLDTNGTWSGAAARGVGLAAVYAFLFLTGILVVFF